MQDKALSLLGLAKKAGMLAVGSEATAVCARQGKAMLIITTQDASAGTKRRARANAMSAGADYLPVHFTKLEIGSITGRGSPGVVAFTDKGMALKFKERVKESVQNAAQSTEYNTEESSESNTTKSTTKRKITGKSATQRNTTGKESDA